MDVFEAIKLKKWDAGIFFPDCTFLTCSAEWAYKEPPYHQKVKPETLVGSDRMKAREEAVDFVKRLWNCGIEKVGIENPVGVLSSRWMKPTQTIQPYQFGHGERKSICLWLKNLPKLNPTKVVSGREQRIWKMPPSPDRAEKRSKTFSGIARAMASQWGILVK